MLESYKDVNNSVYFLPTLLHFCYFEVLMGENNFQNDPDRDSDYRMCSYLCCYEKS